MKEKEEEERKSGESRRSWRKNKSTKKTTGRVPVLNLLTLICVIIKITHSAYPLS